jgi:hypothetical protein
MKSRGSNFATQTCPDTYSYAASSHFFELPELRPSCACQPITSASCLYPYVASCATPAGRLTWRRTLNMSLPSNSTPQRYFAQTEKRHLGHIILTRRRSRMRGKARTTSMAAQLSRRWWRAACRWRWQVGQEESLRRRRHGVLGKGPNEGPRTV